MRAENCQTCELEISDCQVRIISYRLDEFYVSEVESASSGATIAMIVATIPEEARREALETAARRLLRTRDLELTVGG